MNSGTANVSQNVTCADDLQYIMESSIIIQLDLENIKTVRFIFPRPTVYLLWGIWPNFVLIIISPRPYLITGEDNAGSGYEWWSLVFEGGCSAWGCVVKGRSITVPRGPAILTGRENQRDHPGIVADMTCITELKWFRLFHVIIYGRYSKIAIPPHHTCMYRSPLMDRP